jgi:PAS domain S-box-containing protein
MALPSLHTRHWALRYGVAVAATAAAALVMHAIEPLVAPSVTPPFLLAVVLAALFGGVGPGLLALALSLVALQSWFFPPIRTATTIDAARQIMFIAVGVTIAWIAGMVDRQRRRALWDAREKDQLQRAAAESAERANQAHEATARLAAIVSSSSDAIISKTLDGVILSWNAAAERIFGYDAAEMVGQSVYKLIPEPLHDLEREILDRLRHGETVEFSESERIRKDGGRIWISLSVSPLRDPSGKVIGAASIKRDITERKLVAERLRDTQRLQAVGQLAGGIAHEANNQMSVVLGGADFLLRRTDLPKPAREDVELIRHAAERTARITQQLLAFSRRQVLQLQDVDVNHVITTMEPVLRRSLSEVHEMELRLGEETGLMRADARQLEQVLLNLTLNARDAMREGGRLAIETRAVEVSAEHPIAGEQIAAGRYVALVVTDTGEGMSPATLERAFEPFFSTKGVGQGTGLGLSVVHGIVSQIGGHIRVESSPGQGTRFTLYFPRSAPSFAPAAATPRAALPSGNGRVLVLAEDDPDVRAMAGRGLREAGYAVHEVANGREAWTLLQSHAGAVDLVITDIGMPEMDGHELGRRMRSAWPNLPVLYMSGYGDVEPDGPLLHKPFTPDTLVRWVNSALLVPATSRGGVAAD